VMDRIEIWDPSRWREYSTGAQEKFAELDEQPASQN
jgi:MraZ protein